MWLESEFSKYDYYDDVLALFNFEEQDVVVIMQIFDEKKGKIKAFALMD